MIEISTYQACKLLQERGVANLAQNAGYWATRFDYLTIYEFILTHYPTRPRGYRNETAKALSFSKLGGGISGLLTRSWCKTQSKPWKHLSFYNPHWIRENLKLIPLALLIVFLVSKCA